MDHIPLRAQRKFHIAMDQLVEAADMDTLSMGWKEVVSQVHCLSSYCLKNFFCDDLDSGDDADSGEDADADYVFLPSQEKHLFTEDSSLR